MEHFASIIIKKEFGKKTVNSCRSGRSAGKRQVNAMFRIFSSSSHIVGFKCSCDKIYHKQEVRFPLYLLGQIVA